MDYLKEIKALLENEIPHTSLEYQESPYSNSLYAIIDKTIKIRISDHYIKCANDISIVLSRTIGDKPMCTVFYKMANSTLVLDYNDLKTYLKVTILNLQIEYVNCASIIESQNKKKEFMRQLKDSEIVSLMDDKVNNLDGHPTWSDVLDLLNSVPSFGTVAKRTLTLFRDAYNSNIITFEQIKDMLKDCAINHSDLSIDMIKMLESFHIEGVDQYTQVKGWFSELDKDKANWYDISSVLNKVPAYTTVSNKSKEMLRYGYDNKIISFDEIVDASTSFIRGDKKMYKSISNLLTRKALLK